MISWLLAAIATLATLSHASPLHTSGRWIVDVNNHRVKLRCANWAGHMETNIPEGLSHQSVDTIAAWLASNMFNCVRLTYSIDMALDPSISVSTSFSNAARSTGTGSSLIALYSQAVQKNSFLSSATVLSTYGTVIDTLAQHGISVILDNHVSHASWCCSTTDGNGWWLPSGGTATDDNRYFVVSNWLAGLSAMATFAKSHSNVIGMSLRNELRAVSGQPGSPTNDWYNYVAQGARAIHSANSDLLIVIGGVNYATDLSYLYSDPLDRSTFANRTVWEFHSYQWSESDTSTNCTSYQTNVEDKVGYLLASNKAYTGPLWLSEFGVGMTGGPSNGLSTAEAAYLKCLVQHMEGNDADWAVWALQGSYYTRDGSVDSDETYGLLTHDWSGWRNTAFSGLLGRMWNVTQGP